MLELEEDGTFTKISEPYFDSSRCAYLEAYEDASATSQNLTLFDLAGVFLVLGLFAGASFVLWLFRRSPAAKRRWAAYHKRREEERERSFNEVSKRHGRHARRSLSLARRFCLCRLGWVVLSPAGKASTRLPCPRGCR